MMVQKGISWIYQANFPASQSGLTANVYYKIYNSAGSIIQARTNASVIELGPGSYGVNKTFNQVSSYSFSWDIENTPYVANEEVRVYDFATITYPDIYSGYGL